MQNNKHISNFGAGAVSRHPQQEVIDLIAVALLRLREAESSAKKPSLIHDSRKVSLGFAGQKSVNANTDH
jgi:hypothetical protein